MIRSTISQWGRQHFLNKPHYIKPLQHNQKAFYRSADEKFHFETLQDWQYVQVVSKNLKYNNIEQALKYLIQSYLNNKILNKQIYFTFLSKIDERNESPQYKEVLYRLYREHFQPNEVIIDHMRQIVHTESEKLYSLLSDDFKKLNHKMPERTIGYGQQKRQNQKVDEFNEIYRKAQEDIKEEDEKARGRRTRKVPTTNALSQEYFSPKKDEILAKKATQSGKGSKADKNQESPSVSKVDKKRTQPILQMQTKSNVQSFLQSVFGEYGKVTLHDVELQITQYEDDHQDDHDFKAQMAAIEDLNNEYDDEVEEAQEDDDNSQTTEADHKQEMHDNVMNLIASVSKIKIGRVELKGSATSTAFHGSTEKDNTAEDPSKNGEHK